MSTCVTDVCMCVCVYKCKHNLVMLFFFIHSWIQFANILLKIFVCVCVCVIHIEKNKYS